MVEQQMWDPVGRLLSELAEDTGVAAIVTVNPSSKPRVRSPKPATGDVQGPNAYRAHVVISTLALPRHPSVPTQRARHVIRCYGRDPLEAAALYAACSEALHHKGPRQTGSGNGIYVSHDDTGGDYSEDPDSKQPCYTFVVESVATTQAVAP
jgi:hypothetical protein